MLLAVVVALVNDLSLGDVLTIISILIGIGTAIASGIYYGARWTARIEGWIDSVRKAVDHVAATSEAARIENREDHVRIIDRMDHHPAHSALVERVDEHGKRIASLEETARESVCERK